RQLLANSQSSYERDAALIDLAVSQVELGGDGKDVDNGERLTWKDAPTELRQTLDKINSPEAKVRALQEVGRLLVRKGHQNVAALVATTVGNNPPDAPAVVGLAMFPADRERAEKLAQQGLASLPQTGASGGRQDPAPSSLIALCVALRPNVEDPCGGRLPEVPKRNESNDANVALGGIEGWGRQGDASDARPRIGQLSPPAAVFHGYVTLAEAEAAAEAQDAAQADVQEAIKMLEGGNVNGKNFSPWLLRLVKTAINVKLVEKAAVVAAAIPDPGLRGRAQLE